MLQQRSRRCVPCVTARLCSGAAPLDSGVTQETRAHLAEAQTIAAQMQDQGSAWMIHSDVMHTRFLSFLAYLPGQTCLGVERCYGIGHDVTSKGDTALRRAEAFSWEHQPMLGMQQTDALAELGDAGHQALPLFPVSPSVHVDAEPPSPVEVNKTVKFTCHLKGFYPGNVVVTWLENGTEMSMQNTSRLVEMSQGLFQLSSVVEVKAMEEKNGSTFTCRVVHDAQVPVERVTTLWITAPDREGPWGFVLCQGRGGGRRQQVEVGRGAVVVVPLAA
uniref:Ig-like domain-containing protein n=1 Tax=Calidris pygmaea TaxID=425635 RepID=A0A8C3J1H6_9CHAR